MKIVTGMGRLVLLAGLLTLPLSAVHAADLPKLTAEIQKTTTADGQMQMVFWMPTQFWEESMRANPAVNDAQRAEILKVLADYTVIAMMRARVGTLGLTDPASKADLVGNAKLSFDGKALEPVAPEQITPTAQLFLSQVKPAMAMAAGQVGQFLEFVVYPGKVDGKPLDAGQTGQLSLTLYGQNYRWRLPLGSVLPPRVDAKSGEEFPGNYQFNPYTGDKLATKK